MKSIDDFQVRSKAEMYDKLEAAVVEARTRALADGTHGILVTRHDFDRFSISLSLDVPFGLISEHDKTP